MSLRICNECTLCRHSRKYHLCNCKQIPTYSFKKSINADALSRKYSLISNTTHCVLLPLTRLPKINTYVLIIDMILFQIVNVSNYKLHLNAIKVAAIFYQQNWERLASLNINNIFYKGLLMFTSSILHFFVFPIRLLTFLLVNQRKMIFLAGVPKFVAL